MSVDNGERAAGPATSIPADTPGSRDDPRVASVLAAYLAELEAGRRPSCAELLGQNSEIAGCWPIALTSWSSSISPRRQGPVHGPQPTAFQALPANTVLGEFRLVREIGRGGMGIVYEAEQVSLGRRAALKVLSE